MGDLSWGATPYPLLPTCRVCLGGVPVRISDLERSSQAGCAFCALLDQGIARIRPQLTEQLDYGEKLDAVYIYASKTDAHFVVELGSWSFGSSASLEVHFEVFVDTSTTNLGALVPTYNIPRDVPTRLNLARVVSFIRKWSSSCDRFHPFCSIEGIPELPKRVMSISSRNNQPIKLVELSGVHAPYIALSYCWGASNTALKTTSETLPIHMAGIPLESFPKTFKDVIAICRALDIRYLWLDALCIIQDSTEDWEVESAKMTDIYSNSYLTIAASSCADTAHGLFSDRWTLILKRDEPLCRIETGSVAVERGNDTFRLRPRLFTAHTRFAQLDNAHHHSADAPLLTRAWAYQERLLPSRTLHFLAEELVWECKTDLRCECRALDDRSLIAAEFEGDKQFKQTWHGGWLKPLVAKVERPGLIYEDFSMIWMDLVSEFTRLDLTYESDRLPAISGLAAKLTNTCLGDYLAGMWTNMFPVGLLYESRWSAGDFPGDPKYRPQAPTWSWASIPLSGSNGIYYDRTLSRRFKRCPYFKVLNVTAKVLGKNPFGWVQNALLSVRARSAKCVAVKGRDGAMRLERISREDDPAHLVLDIPNSVENHTRIIFLYLGSGQGLALQKVSNVRHEATTYRRVGIARFPLDMQWRNVDWEDGMEMRDFDLV